MVASEAAGVMFTRDPSGATPDLIVSAGYGLGEGVVSGVVETDTYRRGADGHWEVQVVQKLRRVIGRAQSGSEPSATATTELADVRQSLQDVAVLDSAQRDELARVGLRIAGAYDHPQDIEWAYDAAGRLWLTQTRNITTLEPKAASGAAPSTEAPTVVLDNANIIESYPGITLPLTFSHVQHSYHRLFAGLFARLGLSASYLAQHDHVFAQLVAHVNGRVYYQLSNWYRMFALLPGTRRYIPIWERMLGIQGGLSRSHRGEGNQVWLLLRVVGRLIWGALTISREMAALHERFVSAQDQVRQHALSSMNAERLLGMYDELQDQLLPDWDVTLLNDGYAFIFSGLTQRCAALLGLPATDASSLLKAGDSLESLKPVNELTALGKRLRHHPELHAALRELLRHSPPSQPDDLEHRALELLQGVPELHTAFDTYLNRFAERCPEELKLETSSFSERPSAAIRLMLSYADQDSARAPNADRRDAASPSVGWLQRALLSPLVGLARRSIRLRESSRLDRARAFGLVRRIFAAIGNDLSRRGAIEAPRDVFSLSQQEIRDWLRQQSEPRDAPHDTHVEPSTERPLATIVRERRAEFERYAQTRLPSRLVLQAPQATPNGSLRQGSVHLEGATLRSLTREVSDIESSPSVDDAVERLRGLGSSAGTVTAAAEIVLSPDWDVDVSGRILVASATDPGWVFLMVQAAGLVVEQGSLLSHSAIVGRELGIPTVVGVSRATRRIETGDEVEVNGSEGTVHVKRAGRAPAVRDGEGSRP
jgi:rifampicin phosphotransferase